MKDTWDDVDTGEVLLRGSTPKDVRSTRTHQNRQVSHG